MATRFLIIFTAMLSVASLSSRIVSADQPIRARDLGIPFYGDPGPNNAITDVRGVEVGYTTLIEGDGALEIGHGPVRTGVTAILPRGRDARLGVFASRFTLNGDGEMTGTHWIDEFGSLWGPILLTNTVSVGDVHAAALDWMRERKFGAMTHLPVVAETWDGDLNDQYGRHVKREHVWSALDGARNGPLAEGNVGGGTGMISHGFKAGTGTSSRRVGPYTVGVLVQANYGLPWRLTVAGAPVGRELNPDTTAHFDEGRSGGSSIIVIIATDAPLLPMQLDRMAKRAALGVGRVGGIGERTSGDIMLAFSTANGRPEINGELVALQWLSDDAVFTLDYLYQGVIEATEEAILNALVAAKTMVGRDGRRVEAIDHDTLKKVLARYGRLDESAAAGSTDDPEGD